jgi:hypothetical protein
MMADNAMRGRLLISIDLELDVAQRTQADGPRLDEVAGWLVELCRQYQIPATWAVADPARSAASDVVLDGCADHEIAILGDPTWVGPYAGRIRFARELARRVLGARDAGFAASTLVLRDVRLQEHFDLLVKYEISAVRSGMTGTCETLQAWRPKMLRFGVWHFPVFWKLPGQCRWLPGGGGDFTAHRNIQRAIDNKQVTHLVIDGPQLAHSAISARRVIERVLRAASRRREQGLLAIETVGCFAKRLARRRQATPSRSILRPAA